MILTWNVVIYKTTTCSYRYILNATRKHLRICFYLTGFIDWLCTRSTLLSCFIAFPCTADVKLRVNHREGAALFASDRLPLDAVRACNRPNGNALL